MGDGIIKYLWIAAGAAMLLAALTVLIAYICYRMAFLVTRRQREENEATPLPPGRIYEPYHGVMAKWAAEVREMPCREVSIQSFDGLTLWGKYYEYAPGAPIELMFHGYRGTAERDLSGGVQRCFRLGHSALIVDQRASGKSGGHVITFGVNESQDCLSWVSFMTERFGPDVQIILTGISMGASTVLMAGGNDLPENVIGILADCGFTSARDIIKIVIRQMKLPPALSYPFVKLGARLFGGFDLEQSPAIEAVTRCRVPVIFFHGESDDFVPCGMSRENYEACNAPRKALVTIPGAGHGLSYVVDPEKYLEAVSAFFSHELTEAV